MPKIALSNFIRANLTPEINQNPDLSLLKFWIDNGKIDQMSRPMTPQIDPNQRTDILGLIGAMGHDSIPNIDISVVYDIREQIRIRGIYNAEIQDIVETLLSQNFQIQNFQVQGLSVMDKGTLERKKTYMINGFKPGVFSNIERSSLIKLLRPISENLYQQSWLEKEQVLAIRIDQIVAQINAEINEKQRQEEEARRIQAEVAARQAQESANRAEQALRAYQQQEEARRRQEVEREQQQRRDREAAARLWHGGGCNGGPHSFKLRTKKGGYTYPYKCTKCHIKVGNWGGRVLDESNHSENVRRGLLHD